MGTKGGRGLIVKTQPISNSILISTVHLCYVMLSYEDLKKKNLLALCLQPPGSEIFSFLPRAMLGLPRIDFRSL